MRPFGIACLRAPSEVNRPRPILRDTARRSDSSRTGPVVPEQGSVAPSAGCSTPEGWGHPSPLGKGRNGENGPI